MEYINLYYATARNGRSTVIRYNSIITNDENNLGRIVSDNHVARKIRNSTLCNKGEKSLVIPTGDFTARTSETKRVLLRCE